MEEFEYLTGNELLHIFKGQSRETTKFILWVNSPEKGWIPFRRMDAAAVGSLFFFDQEPCANGHRAAKHVNCANCVICYPKGRKTYRTYKMRPNWAKPAKVETAIEITEEVSEQSETPQQCCALDSSQ
jgi:hypothetical protein